MPLYEYRCGTCEHRFEDLVRSADGPHPKSCPECGAGAVERMISVFAAREGSPSSSMPLPPSGCGHCGDPNGPCR